jgi:hypothetical protein
MNMVATDMGVWDPFHAFHAFRPSFRFQCTSSGLLS